MPQSLIMGKLAEACQTVTMGCKLFFTGNRYVGHEVRFIAFLWRKSFGSSRSIVTAKILVSLECVAAFARVVK